MKRKGLIMAAGGTLTGLLLAAACQKASDAVSPTSTMPTTSTSVTVGTGVPDVYKKLYGATSIYVEGSNIVIKTSGRPDHKSPYYKGTAWESSLYEAYNGTNARYAQNPNVIAETSLTYKIPMNPAEDPTHAATPLGSTGVALNGVAFFNQYAAQNAPLTNEINGFDQYGGHPQQQGQYHYHLEPTYLTKNKGKDALMGFLLDGFPVYGPVENGKTITNADLDKYHGHIGKTADYPSGIYHYHITAEDPYISGSGFYGKAGTVTR
ncbi:YHYH protein [Fibrella sp. WM1]|uniref:YHYH protein n=1 Tax=Fibrella musci TaxID=3242485 RepID=UPI00351FD30D